LIACTHGSFHIFQDLGLQGHSGSFFKKELFRSRVKLDSPPETGAPGPK
jgi:hypothetical protein